MRRLGSNILLIGIAALGVAGTAEADRPEGAATARTGIVRCGGTNHLRQGGREVHVTHYNLRNLNSADSITIDRLKVLDATGAVLYDSAQSGLPAGGNGVLGPANNLLGPNQTAQLQSEDFLAFLDNGSRPIQAEFQWSAPKSVLTLDAGTSRLVRQRDPATGAVQDERARSSGSCRSIFLK